MALGRKTGGRKPGSRNKKPPRSKDEPSTPSIREAFVWAFNNIGADRGLTGAECLAEWGRTSPGEFFKLAARLIPVELIGDKDKPVHIVTRAE